MSKMLITIAAAAALTFTAHVASADDATPEPRSRNTAFALSAGGTALSIGLVALGGATHNGTLAGAGVLSSLISPSAGEFYAGRPITAGMGLRVSSGLVVLWGFAEGSKCLEGDAHCHDNAVLGGALIAAGALGYVTGVAYDIATAGSAVDAYNRKHNLHVAPTVLPTASSGPAVGMAIGGTF
ncbi:MAG TPA: hypothetical protein VGD37_16935 [Kofleriaceae bacterium]|jgi:hypothetical protein